MYYVVLVYKTFPKPYSRDFFPEKQYTYSERKCFNKFLIKSKYTFFFFFYVTVGKFDANKKNYKSIIPNFMLKQNKMSSKYLFRSIVKNKKKYLTIEFVVYTSYCITFFFLDLSIT